MHYLINWATHLSGGPMEAIGFVVAAVGVVIAIVARGKGYDDD